VTAGLSRLTGAARKGSHALAQPRPPTPFPNHSRLGWVGAAHVAQLACPSLILAVHRMRRLRGHRLRACKPLLLDLTSTPAFFSHVAPGLPTRVMAGAGADGWSSIVFCDGHNTPPVTVFCSAPGWDRSQKHQEIINQLSLARALQGPKRPPGGAGKAHVSAAHQSRTAVDHSFPPRTVGRETCFSRAVEC